jgi:sugar transferase (PEP-CTERM/EpsH1 system associated)
MSKKVMHLVYSLGIGGLERVIVNLVNHSEGEKVHHFLVTQTPNVSLASELPASIEIFCLNKAEGNDIKSHFRLFKLLKKLKPDVLHTYNFGTLEYQVTALLAGVPCRIHAEHGRETSDPSGKSKSHDYFRYLVSHVLTYFVVVSPDLQEWALKQVHIKKSKIRLVYNGVPQQPLPVRHQDEQAPFVIVTAGRLSEVKNQHLLLSAFALFLDKGLTENTELWIIGEGHLKKVLEQKAIELGIQNKVTLWGARDDVIDLFAKSDVFALTSVYEAMPMTILEAMSVACPVISTDVGGVSNILFHNKNGLLVEPSNAVAIANALQALFSSKALRDELGNNGYNCITSKYSVNAMSQTYLELYGII